MNAIELESINVRLGESLAIKNLSLQFPKGRWVAVIGPNGAGKSTLLRVIAGLCHSTGKVKLLDQYLDEVPTKVRAQNISWLGQSEDVVGDMTVYDIVMLGRLPHQKWLDGPSAEDHEVVLEVLSQMNALGWVNRLIGELSGGERQRVLLARALAVKAEIFLMDEPLANLDPSHQSDCLNLIRSLTHEGKTVITVLHEVSFALNADEVIVMESGNLIAHSKAQDFKLHRVIETVFNDRISIQPLGDQFVITMNYKTTYKSESNSYGN